MIELERSKDHKWILQKNISKVSLFIDFIDALSNQDNLINNTTIKEYLQNLKIIKKEHKKKKKTYIIQYLGI